MIRKIFQAIFDPCQHHCHMAGVILGKLGDKEVMDPYVLEHFHMQIFFPTLFIVDQGVAYPYSCVH